jgi:hypothetical protein
VRQDKCGTEPAENYTLFYRSGNRSDHLGRAFFVCTKDSHISSYENTVHNAMIYVILRSQWYDISALNVKVPTDNKSANTKDRFYKDLRVVSSSILYLPRENSTVSGNSNAKTGTEDVFKQFKCKFT